MENFFFVFAFALGAVACMALAMSLALFIRGHFRDLDISTNRHMQAMGIKCAVQQSRIDDGAECHDFGCHSNCAGCDIDHEAALVAREAAR